MNVRNVLVGITLVAATAAFTTQVVSQDKGKAPPQMSPEEQAMMQKCMEAGTPGENHKLLASKVGKWNATGKMWMTPDMPPQDSTATSEVTSLWENRYFMESVEGSMPEGGTFLGKSCFGYDNVAKKFWWAWIDNMGTSLMSAEGSYDAASKTFKYATKFSCPIAEKVVTGRSVEKWIDNDHYVMEMYAPWPKTGKEYKNMELTFTRAK